MPFPTKENHIWNVAEFGDDKCTIHPFDKGYVVGWLYVGVYGFSDSEFSINVRWKNRGDGNGPSSSSRQQTGVSAENSYDSVFSQVPLSTPPRHCARLSHVFPLNMFARACARYTDLVVEEV